MKFLIHFNFKELHDVDLRTANRGQADGQTLVKDTFQLSCKKH